MAESRPAPLSSIVPGHLLPALAAVAFLLVAAVARLPYSFYVLLRFAVCGISLYYAQRHMEEQRTAWMWVFAAVAVLFNPLIPVRMSRADWRVVNVIAAGLFLCWGLIWCMRNRPEPAKQAPPPDDRSYQPLSPEGAERVLENVRLLQQDAQSLKTPRTTKVQ